MYDDDLTPDDELTPRERAAFDALPRERDTGRLLEERTVRALRSQGLLRPEAARPAFFTTPWLSAAAAAFVAVFLGGFAAGQWLESRSTKEMLVEMHARDGAAAAAQVQRAGSAYLAALAAFANLADSSSTRDLRQGREVAVNTLHEAANQLVRIAPEDPLAAQILQGLDRAAQRDTTAGDEARQVIWF
jgi:hypothetical protein